MTDDSLTIETELRQALTAFVQKVVPEIMRPSELYDEGNAELLKEYGEQRKIPVTALAENAKATEGYNAVPMVIADVLFQLRNILAQHMGPTGAQMAYADGELLARSVGFDGPMRIVKADSFLFPQLDGTITEWSKSDTVREWLATRAQELLLETDPPPLRADSVRRRLEALAVSPKDVEIVP